MAPLGAEEREMTRKHAQSSASVYQFGFWVNPKLLFYNIGHYLSKHRS